MTLTQVQPKPEIASEEPSPAFEGLGAFGWLSLVAIAAVAFLLVSNF